MKNKKLLRIIVSDSEHYCNNSFFDELLDDLTIYTRSILRANNSFVLVANGISISYLYEVKREEKD